MPRRNEVEKASNLFQEVTSLFGVGLFCFALLPLFPQLASAGLAAQCEGAFFVPKPMDRMSLATLRLAEVAMREGGPFADREESKFTVQTNLVEFRVAQLHEDFGRAMKARDITPAGTENVTSTEYVAKMRYRNYEGDERRVKIRFREYLTTDTADLDLKRVKNTSKDPDKVWIEVKIQHPTQDKKVIKVRALGFKTDQKFLIDDQYLTYRDQIVARLASLNLVPSSPGGKPLMTQEKFDLMVQFFDAVYTSPRKRTGLFAKTMYRRRSFAVKLFVVGQKEPIEIQFTMDDRIRLVRLQDGKKFESYLKDQTVVEVKIPSLFAGMTAKDLETVKGLRTIKEFVEWLESRHDPRLPMNKGKLSKIRENESREVDREVETGDMDILETLD
jgi:hypothetical protein